MQASRQDQLLQVLLDVGTAVSGPELAKVLGVSTRSVRQYVRTLNRAAGGPMVQASHRGYALDEAWVSRFADSRAAHHRADTPMQRLYYIARRLVMAPDGEDVYGLAEMLCVSDSTVEADLTKVRGLLREFDLALRRDRSVVRITGSERNQRRLVRQLLLESTKDVKASRLSAALTDFQAYDLPGLTANLRTTLDAHGLQMQEYALQDLALHVVIAVARIASGHVRETCDPIAGGDAVLRAVDELSDKIEHERHIVVPDAERHELVRLVMTRAGGAEDGTGIVGDEYLTLVRSILTELADQYLLDIDDTAFVVNLSLHVRNLVARARSGSRARNPIGAEFKQSHPLVHELAVFVARGIEAGAGIALDEDEIVFFGFHLGAYLQKTLEATDQVTVVCVAPRYYDVHESFIQRLATHLGDSARIVETITTLDHPWQTVDADLVVTSAVLPDDVAGPVLLVSPVPTRAELDKVAETVRVARTRKASARIRWTVSELLDPRLFLHVTSATQMEALRAMCGQLEAEGVVGPTFLDDVLERERLSPTAFGGSIAVPHSMQMNSRRTAISVLISDEPIDWAGSQVRLVALFALSPNGRQVFRDVLDDFITTLADPVRISTVVDASESYDGFVRALVSEFPA